MNESIKLDNYTLMQLIDELMYLRRYNETLSNEKNILESHLKNACETIDLLKELLKEGKKENE